MAYQKILQLSYVDKFLNDIHLEFRDKYKNDLADGRYFQEFDFLKSYREILQTAEDWAKTQAKAPKSMRSFDQSNKSKKTIASMVERKGDEKKINKKKEVNFNEEPAIQTFPPPKEEEEDVIASNRAKFAQKMSKKKPDVKYAVLHNLSCTFCELDTTGCHVIRIGNPNVSKRHLA